MLTEPLPAAITVDVCWHRGRLVVARHSPPTLVVESYAPDLTDRRDVWTIPMHGGNAAARVASWNDQLWLLYRDEADLGFLVVFWDGGQTVIPLGPVVGQRPFAVGDGYFGFIFDNPAQHAKVRALEAPDLDITVQGFPDYVPTGLSHLSGTQAVSWDSQRQLHPWALNFVRSGPVEFGQGFHDDGLIGRLDGHANEQFNVWRDALMNDQRLSVQGDQCAVIAWSPAAGVRLGLVTVADLEPIPDGPTKPEPIPVDQVIPLHGKWLVGWYEQKGPPEWLDPPQPFPPGNLEVAVHTVSYPEGCTRPRPVMAMLDGYHRIASSVLLRLGSEGQHDENGLRALEAHAWDCYNQGIQCAVYWDARNLPFWPALPPDAIWEQNAYCGVDEPLDAFEAFLEQRTREALEHYQYLLLTAQTHTTNATLLREPSQAIPPVARVLTRRRAEVGERCAGLLIFNNSGRDDTNPDSPTYGEGGLTANPQHRPHWERLFSGVTGLPDIFTNPPDDGGGGGGTMTIEIVEIPARVQRSDPGGLRVHFDITADRRIVAIEFGLCDSHGDRHEPPFLFEIELGATDDAKDGRYLRQVAWKPVRDGVWHVYVQATDEAGGVARQTSDGTVEVYS